MYLDREGEQSTTENMGWYYTNETSILHPNTSDNNTNN